MIVYQHVTSIISVNKVPIASKKYLNSVGIGSYCVKVVSDLIFGLIFLILLRQNSINLRKIDAITSN